MKYLIPAFAIALAACSSHSTNDAAEQQADALDNAADQSSPKAADVLHDQADAIRETAPSARRASRARRSSGQ